MFRPRITIAGIMTFTALVAFDLAAFMGTLFTVKSLAGLLLLTGTLPMANIMIVATLRLRKRRRRGDAPKPFLTGFVFAGWISLVAFAIACFLATNAIMACVDYALYPVVAHLHTLNHDLAELLGLILMVSSHLLPQLLPALLVGWLFASRT